MKFTITGVDLNGKQVSETFDIPEGNRTFYSSNRYQSLTPPEQPLRLYFRRLSLWQRFVLRFFKRWRTVINIEEPKQGERS